MFGRVFLSEKYKATYSIGSKTNVSKPGERRKTKGKQEKGVLWLWKSRKSRASVIFLSLAGTPVDGEHEPEKYRVPQFNHVDLDVPGLFTSSTERRSVKFKFLLEKLKS